MKKISWSLDTSEVTSNRFVIAMSQCASCESALSPKRSLVCSTCGDCFHPACTSVKTFENFRKLGKKRDSWRCVGCKRAPAGDRNPADPSDESSDDGGAVGELSTPVRRKSFGTTSDAKIVHRLDAIAGAIKDLEKSASYNSEKLDDVLLRFKGFEKSLKKIAEENDALRAENLELRNEVQILGERINRCEQQDLVGDIEISGIPQTPNEDIPAIVIKAASVVGVTMEKSHIFSAFRVNANRKPGSVPSIIASLATIGLKQQLLGAMKEKRELAKIGSVHPDFSKDQRFYVNDRLTPFNRFLRWLTKMHAVEYGYKYVWCSNGRVQIKKNDGDRPQVSTLNLLRKIDVNAKFRDIKFLSN